ncbi:MAG: hypothetical protein R3E96_00560 [Planctomycetota bacterium]
MLPLADVGTSGSFFTFLERNARGEFLFAAQPSDSEIDVVYRVDGPGQAPVALTPENPDRTYIESVALSPDGNYLAYYSDSDTLSDLGLWVLDVRDGTRVQAIDFNVDLRTFVRMQWTGDSQYLVVELDSSGSSLVGYSTVNELTWELAENPTFNGIDGVQDWLLHPETGDLYILTDEELITQNELFRAALDGSGRTRLTDTPVGSGEAFSFLVSPDGSQVAYSSNELDAGKRSCSSWRATAPAACG